MQPPPPAPSREGGGQPRSGAPGGRGRQRLLPRPPLHRLRRPSRGVGAGMARAARPPAPGLVAGRCHADRRVCWSRRRCCWRLDATPASREAFSGGRFAPARWTGRKRPSLRRIEGHTWSIRRCPTRCGWKCRTGCPFQSRFGQRSPRNGARCGEPAPLDLRVNLLKATREEAQAALAAEGWEAAPTPLLALGPAHRRPPAGHHRPGVHAGPGGDPGRGQPAGRRAGRRRTGHARRRLVRRGGRQDPGAGQHDAEPRPDRRLRRVRAAAGGRGPPPAPRGRSQRRAPSGRNRATNG